MDNREAITRRFRDFFFACLDMSYSDTERQELVEKEKHHFLVHLPNESLAPDLSANSAEELLRKLDEAYCEISPIDVHRHGLEIPTEQLERERLDQSLRKQPVTLVVFPGIFSEFIEAGSFDRIFSIKSTTCAERWKHTLKEFGLGNSQPEVEDAVFDEQFSLDLLDSEAHDSPYERRRLSELIEVASIDDADGTPLVQVVRFRHRLMSLETIGSIEKIAEILTRRLRKFFELMGTPENIALLGYSMGTPVALDALAKAYEKNESWVSNVRAVVSVGGVVYGSHAADDAIHPTEDRLKNPSHLQVKALTKLEETLRRTSGLFWLKRKPHGRSKLSVLWTNTKAWFEFGAAWSDSVKEMANSGAKIPIPKLIRIGRKVDVKPVLGLAARVGVGTFSLFNPFRYSSNVRKFKRLVRAALSGIESLTTEARKRWWRENILPTKGIKYYAVAGTMFDPLIDSDDTGLSTNTLADNPMSLDYQILLNGYRGIVDSAKQRLNDGQMAAVRAQFWPELAGFLNHTYTTTPIDGVFLGLFSAHHWGLTLPEVNAMHTGPNPFPRSALLKALAVQIAWDIEEVESDL